MTDLTKIDQYLKTHLEESIAELTRFCAQPSVAAQNWGMAECAALTAEMLQARGFRVEVLQTGGSPVVYAERKGRSNRTLLFYNHYDVQPAEPLELWTSPPFQPEIRDGKLYARGVSDDKGHLTSRLFAIDALLANEGELPCNVKFLVEGEEEISSVHLPGFIRDHQEMLAAEACVWEFGDVDHRGVPMQYTGMRGICYVELLAETAEIDAHSGTGGSIFPNAAWRLVWALNTIKGPDERIRIPGHYDRVVPPSQRDIELLEAMPEVAEEYRERYSLKEFLKGMSGGVELRLAQVFEPTCTVCGLTAGYQGPARKRCCPPAPAPRLISGWSPTSPLKRRLKTSGRTWTPRGFRMCR
jgi:acetylornithine deacetylase/succinyl-diaminopimelate desuccinylase-like protein